MDVYHNTREYYNQQTAHSFQSYREPIGNDITTGMIMVYSKQTREEIRILDAGCGTGSQAKALIKFGFRRITLLDQSSAMLKLAHSNLSEEIRDNYIEEIVEETLPVIPFADNSFDVVMFTLVLHHIGNPQDGQAYPTIVATLKEAHRVLRPNGIMVITTVAPTAIQEEIAWYYKLIPRLNSLTVDFFPTMSKWDDIFGDTRFRCVSKTRVLGKEANGPYYTDEEGPLKEEWRNSFPYFGLATTDEIKEMVNKVTTMKENGSLKQWVSDMDKSNEHGIYAILVCIAE